MSDRRIDADLEDLLEDLSRIHDVCGINCDRSLRSLLFDLACFFLYKACSDQAQESSAPTRLEDASDIELAWILFRELQRVYADNYQNRQDIMWQDEVKICAKIIEYCPIDTPTISLTRDILIAKAQWQRRLRGRNRSMS